MRIFGIIPLGIGLAAIGFLWFGSFGSLGTPPLIVRICGTCVALPFLLIGVSQLLLNPDSALDQQMEQLAQSLPKTPAPPIPAAPLTAAPVSAPRAAAPVAAPPAIREPVPASARPMLPLSPITGAARPVASPVAPPRRPVPPADPRRPVANAPAPPRRPPAGRPAAAPPVNAPPAPPPADMGAALGYVCPDCCKPLGRRVVVTPQGDTTCPNCGRAFNIHA